MKPLIERLGQEFFRSAPRAPGVYVMRGAREQILYIGQSKDLRTRLSFYKNANPDRIPRRLIRLVHQVENISWECLPSPEAARARELELLRLHRPRFNRADTGPQFFHYVHWRLEPNQLSIEISEDEPIEVTGNLRGPIRGKLIPYQALAAWQRLAQSVSCNLTRCAELPFTPKRLASLNYSASESLLFNAIQFLHGNSPDLVTNLLEKSAPQSEICLRQLQETDAETLLSWFKVLALAEKDFAA